MTLRLDVKIDPSGTVLVYDKKQLRKVMRAAGSEVAGAARKLVLGAVGGGKVYRGSGGNQYRPRKAGAYSASAPGQAPVNVTGTLAKSIKPRVGRGGTYVKVESAFYGLFLEYGAKGGIGSGSKGVRGKSNPRQTKRTKQLGLTPSPVGTRMLEPRPFLSTALSSREASIGSRISDSIAKDIAFVKQK